MFRLLNNSNHGQTNTKLVASWKWFQTRLGQLKTRCSAFPAKLRESKQRGENNDAANKSLDVRAKQRLSCHVAWLILRCRWRFRPTSYSIVRFLSAIWVSAWWGIRNMENPIRHEPALSPDDLEKFFILRANAGDVEGLVALYEPNAVIAGGNGQIVIGTEAIHRFFCWTARNSTSIRARGTIPFAAKWWLGFDFITLRKWQRDSRSCTKAIGRKVALGSRPVCY